jgi:hypothetical protein
MSRARAAIAPYQAEAKLLRVLQEQELERSAALRAQSKPTHCRCR